MEPSEQERATECVTPAEVMAKINAVSRQPVREGSGDERGGNAGVRPASSVEGSGPLSPVPRLRPWSPGSQAAGRLCWEAGLLEKARAWARNPVHARNHALPRLRAHLAPQWKWGSSREINRKDGSGRTLHCQNLPAAQTFGPCRRWEPCWAWRRDTLAEIRFPGAFERGRESGGQPASTT